MLKKYDRQQVQISKVNVHKQIIRKFWNILNFFAIYRWEIQNSYAAIKPAVWDIRDIMIYVYGQYKM